MIIEEIERVLPIRQWTEVPEGTRVIEDTYNELYEMKWQEGKPYLHHIGWRYERKGIRDRYLCKSRLADFEPNCTYDQPWFMEVK